MWGLPGCEGGGGTPGPRFVPQGEALMGAVGVLGVLPQRVPGLGCASSPHEVGLGEAPYTTPTWLGAEASKLGAH